MLRQTSLHLPLPESTHLLRQIAVAQLIQFSVVRDKSHCAFRSSVSHLIVTYKEHGNVVVYKTQESVPALIVLRGILCHLLYDLPLLSGLLYGVSLHRSVGHGET